MARRADALHELCLEADRALGSPSDGVGSEKAWRADAQRDTYDSDVAESDDEPSIPQSYSRQESDCEHAKLIDEGNQLQGVCVCVCVCVSV